MTQLQKPEWVQKASQEIAALHQRGVEKAQQAKEHLQASEQKLSQSAHATEEQIAAIIQKHFSAHKA